MDRSKSNLRISFCLSIFAVIQRFSEVKLKYINIGTVKPTRTRIRLLVPPKSIRSIIDATQREQRHGSA